MEPFITDHMLINAGLNKPDAHRWMTLTNDFLEKNLSRERAWQEISRLLIQQQCPFLMHHAIFTSLFPNWHEAPDSAPVWIPTADDIAKTNIMAFMTELGIPTVKEFHEYSRANAESFWQAMLKKLAIVFKHPPTKVYDLTRHCEHSKAIQPIISDSLKLETGLPRYARNDDITWFPDASMNIADSCFTAPPDHTALIYENASHELEYMTYAELNCLSNQIANSLIQAGFKAQDGIAIIMPMNQFAVAAYLGIIKMGGVVISIADSFSAQEIATRLQIAKARGVFTQDYSPWSAKKIPIYEKITAANAPKAIVLTAAAKSDVTLRAGDVFYHDFLVANGEFESAPCSAMMPCNILFSSGTTADPKAIPWNHCTPIKAASDAHLHQNIQSGDVITWPTNLGWMMGPWLVFAGLINGATVALYTGAPKGREFGEFVEKAKVTMLGVVPTLVATWRQSHCMEGLDWHRIKAFSSTGECSNAEDMFYLMWLAQYKPVIEYCGGTEIGGAYVSSTMVENNYASLFTTPTMGSDFVILNEQGEIDTLGEVALIPPALGLSVNLLNADHEKVYYTGMPILNGTQLRRHGDQICQLKHHTYAILGRVDDTMNLGGIKVSAAEIERAIADMPSIQETAAIAIKPADNGPTQLVIYAVTEATLDKAITIAAMQKRINQYLNPLFKIHDVVLVKELPKTSSNKIMRRVLRKGYVSG